MIFSCSSLCQTGDSSGRINRFRKTRVFIDQNLSVITLSFQCSSQNDTFRDNLLLVSDRFVSQGKFSVTLKQPRRVICFRGVSPATASTVCSYLNCVKCGTQFNPDSSQIALESLSNAPTAELLIEQLKDYPLGSSFPSSLRNLHIKSIKLDNFDTRILRLTQLSILKLEESNISTITKDIAMLNLVRLCLNSNSISLWPSIPKDSPLSSSLTYLDLSGNRLTSLPLDFWNLENLETLNLNENQLMGITPVNLHRILRLKNLSLRNNQLACLPFAFTCLQSTGCLDLSGNPWIAPTPPLQGARFEPRSLFHYATVAFLKAYGKNYLWSPVVARARWGEDTLPERVATEALGVLRRCAVCLNVCGPESQRFLEAVNLRFAQLVVSEPSSVIHYCCSNRCAQRFSPPQSTPTTIPWL